MSRLNDPTRPPCPFCGHDDPFLNEYLIIECHRCHAQGPDIEVDYDLDDPRDCARAEALVWAAWGRRTGAATTPGAAGEGE